MAWLDAVLTRLSATSQWTYLSGGPRAAEPAALAALALVAHGRLEAAHAPLDWLVTRQSADGAVAVTETHSHPAWTTAWAVLAWQVADTALPGGARRRGADRKAMARGVDWLLAARGATTPLSDDMGHDTTLVGWPWVLGTHSWVEPTALAVLALRASGALEHPRTRQGIRLLGDRLLPEGGCNYGNTVVLGQTLRPHVEPTGLCLWALPMEAAARVPGSENDSIRATDANDPRLRKSLDYLGADVATQSAAASLCYALLGLAAHGRRPATSERQLAAAAERTLARAPSTYRLALLALAAEHDAVSLVPATRGAATASLGDDTASHGLDAVTHSAASAAPPVELSQAPSPLSATVAP